MQFLSTLFYKMAHFATSYIPFPRMPAHPPFNDDAVVKVWHFFRHTNITSTPNTTIKINNERALFTMNFNPPYSYGNHITITMGSIDKDCWLVGRIPIAMDDEDGSTMDFRAILIHYSPGFEETIMIPVPSSFFHPNFFRLNTILPSSLPHDQPLHTYPPNPNPTPETPITPHVDEQLRNLGEEEQPQEPIPPRTGTWKNWVKEYFFHIFTVFGFLLIIGMLVIVVRFPGHTEGLETRP